MTCLPSSVGATSANTHGLPTAALALFYRIKRLIPRAVQLSLRRALIRRQGSPRFPAWPFERAGSDLVRIALVDALLERNMNAIRFPGSGRTERELRSR